jgi:hypothetical protein
MKDLILEWRLLNNLAPKIKVVNKMKYVYPAVFTLLPDDEYDTHSGFTLLHYMRQKHDRRYRNGREMLLLCGYVMHCPSLT